MSTISCIHLYFTRVSLLKLKSILLEYNSNYKNSAALRKLKEKKQKLFDEDIEPPKEFERMILCHILEKDDNASASLNNEVEAEDEEIVPDHQVQEEEKDEPLIA
jgi:hypothetical protein